MRSSLIFRQLFSAPSSTYTYLLGCGVTRKALLIDAVLEEVERDVKLVAELELMLEYSVNTHMHADHVRSCEELKKAFPKLKSVQGDKLGKSDILISNGDIIQCGQNVHLSCLHTPGHTPGCYSYFFNHENHPMVFTGDAMLIRKCGRTDFQNGNVSELYDSIQILFGLPDVTVVLPGHVCLNIFYFITVFWGYILCLFCDRIMLGLHKVQLKRRNYVILDVQKILIEINLSKLWIIWG
eukprot:333171_1